MKEKPLQKKPSEITPLITPLLITGNDRLSPYIQVFTHQPENISQHALGVLFGVFKINDISVDSAFIVNFLVSELKKEYYGNPRRTPAGSFEAGLNRINIALSELAKQGNIAWIGKLESAICALEKNGMMHFSVTGNTHIALMREGSLSLISEGLAPETTNPNPLKTFIEISSGKLHPEDVVILGTHELFDFLPKEKMERNIKHFTHQEFTRFLHTALTNEYELCGAVTVLLNKRPAPPITKNPDTSSAGISSESIPNMFSAKAFHKNPPRQALNTKNEKEEEISETKKSSQEGHFYIQQQPSSVNTSHQKLREIFLVFKEHFANILDGYFITIQNSSRQVYRSLKKKILSKEIREGASEEHAPSEPISNSPSLQVPSVKDSQETPELTLAEMPHDTLPLKEILRLNTLSFTKIFRSPSFPRSAQLFHAKIQPFFQQIIILLKRFASRSFLYASQSFHTIKKLFFSLSKRGKIITLVCLCILLITPILLFLPKKDAPKNNFQETSTEKPAPPTRDSLFSQEKNMTFVKQENIATLYTSQYAILDSFIISTDTLVLVEEKSVLLLSLNAPIETFVLPEENGLALSATYMTDLSLLFILTDKGSILSFSPLSKKFSQNNLVLENVLSEKPLLGSYLTYLYVANTQKNTILRYPRAEGGFGSPSVWLSADSGISLTDTVDMSIDGSLHLAKPNEILRLTNKKKDPLALEQTVVPTQFGSIFTNADVQTIILTDKQNNRALFYTKEGSIEKQILLPENIPSPQNTLVTKDGSVFLQTENKILHVKK